MKITALVENTSADENIGAEHGLSLFIEANNQKLLFDIGQTDLFSENAQKLNLDLSSVDFAVLSHGHYDHGGGLEKFLEINKNAPIYINEFAFEPHYNGTEKYIGLDVSLKNNPRIIFTGDEYIIKENFTLYSCNGNQKRYDSVGTGLNMLQNNELLPDDFRHEQYLLIEEDNKTVLISGCSHKGILNISSWFNVDFIIGGFHFSKLPLDDTLEAYAKLLNKKNTAFFTCHCTGVEQYEFMKDKMSNLNYLSAGQTIEI